MKPEWTVEFSRRAQKLAKHLPNEIQALLAEAVADLQRYGPHCPQWQSSKLSASDAYRLKLNYRYRVEYKVTKQYLLINIINLGHRKNAYQ